MRDATDQTRPAAIRSDLHAHDGTKAQPQDHSADAMNQNQTPSRAPRSAPEPIHPDKEHRHPPTRSSDDATGPPIVPQHMTWRNKPDRPKPLASPRYSRTDALNTNPKTGGDDRDRTDDPLLAKQVLSQLSYAPRQLTDQDAPTRTHQPGTTWWAREDLNLRPHAYQACALTS